MPKSSEQRNETPRSSRNYDEGMDIAQKRPIDWLSVVLTILATIFIVVGIWLLSSSIGKTTLSLSSSSKSDNSAVASVSTSSMSSSSAVSSSDSMSSSTSSISVSSSSSASSASAIDPKTAPLQKGITKADVKVKAEVNGNFVGVTVIETGFTGRWFGKTGVTWTFTADKFSFPVATGDTLRLNLTVPESSNDGNNNNDAPIGATPNGNVVINTAYKL